MPLPENEKTIQEMQRDHILGLSDLERFERIFTLFGDYYRSAAHRMQKEHPEMSEREIRIVMTKRLYGGDPRTMQLIQQYENEHFPPGTGRTVPQDR